MIAWFWKRIMLMDWLIKRSRNLWIDNYCKEVRLMIEKNKEYDWLIDLCKAGWLIDRCKIDDCKSVWLMDWFKQCAWWIDFCEGWLISGLIIKQTVWFDWLI